MFMGIFMVWIALLKWEFITSRLIRGLEHFENTLSSDPTNTVPSTIQYLVLPFLSSRNSTEITGIGSIKHESGSTSWCKSPWEVRKASNEPIWMALPGLEGFKRDSAGRLLCMYVYTNMYNYLYIYIYYIVKYKYKYTYIICIYI